jgi:hypothetical protein
VAYTSNYIIFLPNIEWKTGENLIKKTVDQMLLSVRFSKGLLDSLFSPGSTNKTNGRSAKMLMVDSPRPKHRHAFTMKIVR